MNASPLCRSLNYDLDINNRQTVEAGLQYFRTVLEQFHADISNVRTKLQGVVCSLKAESQAKEDLICLRDFTEWVLYFCKEQHTDSVHVRLGRIVSDAEVLFRSLCNKAKYTDLTYCIHPRQLLSQASNCKCPSSLNTVCPNRALLMESFQVQEQCASKSEMYDLSGLPMSLDGVCDCTSHTLLSAAPCYLSNSVRKTTKCARKEQDPISRSSPLSLSLSVIPTNYHRVSGGMPFVQPHQLLSSSPNSLPFTEPVSISGPITSTMNQNISNVRSMLATSLETTITHSSRTNCYQHGKVLHHLRRTCLNCFKGTSRQWVRKFKGESKWLCHACGQYWRKNRRDRPSELWQKPVLRRNSKRICGQRNRRSKRTRNVTDSVLSKSSSHFDLQLTSENVKTTTDPTKNPFFSEAGATTLTLCESAVHTRNFFTPELPNSVAHLLEVPHSNKADERSTEETLHQTNCLPSFQSLLSSIRKDKPALEL